MEKDLVVEGKLLAFFRLIGARTRGGDPGCISWYGGARELVPGIGAGEGGVGLLELARM